MLSYTSDQPEAGQDLFDQIEQCMESDFGASTDVWREIVLKKYVADTPTNHHQLMNYIVDNITNVLRRLNGETEPSRKDYYKYFAYDLLHTDQGWVSEGFLSQSELDYLNLLNSQVESNIDCP